MTCLRRLRSTILALAVAASALTSCQWQGLNSLPLPGTAGQGAGSFEVQAQLRDITNVHPNSRVRVGDVTVGNVTRIQRQGWHALVTMRLDGDVELPENATAKIGQTSLLGSLHVELASPTDQAPQGRLHQGSLIALQDTGSYPTTEQTLAAVSTLLNGGGLSQAQDITAALSTAFNNGRNLDLRALLERITVFVSRLNTQTGDIITASERLNDVAGQFAAREPVIDEALRTLPGALTVLSDRRSELVEALDRLGKLSALVTDTVDHTKSAIVTELQNLGPVLQSLADSGKYLTRSLGILLTFPFPEKNLANWIRGDYGNLTGVIDLTLSRLDSVLLTGTRFEGSLTALEMQWGRTIGQLPSPATAGNPLVVPYHLNQGP